MSTSTAPLLRDHEASASLLDHEMTASLLDQELRASLHDPEGRASLLDHEVRAALRDPTLPASVSAVLYEMLPHGAANIGTVARRLQHTERSLRRQLQALGTNYRSISNRVRLELTQRYLRQGLPVEDVIRLVGFHGRGQFYRAFKRWTGHTPSAANNYTDAATYERDVAGSGTLGGAPAELATRSC